ncbi:MAG: NAD(P)-dependent oxidoreductase [Myxococcales bacterium]|nr:NAD(P)-dependent oxidoreductase [Myxococcales bacterium]
METRNVTFLGLGTMGSGMAIQLHQAGFRVTGYNRTYARTEALLSEGIIGARNLIPAIQQAESIILCLSDDHAIDELLFTHGVIHQISANTLVLDCSTTSLATTKKLHQACLARGSRFLDAPVTGSKLGAETGQLTFMVGGETEDLQAAQPLFDAMGRYVVHAGPNVGDGQRAKYCLNMTQAIVLQGVLEGYALAKAQGLSIEVMEDIFEHSAGKTGVGTFKTPYLKEQDYTPHFRLDLMQKDLHLALSQASDARLPLPLARAVSTLYDLAARNGLGPEDFLATAKLIAHPNDKTQG